VISVAGFFAAIAVPAAASTVKPTASAKAPFDFRISFSSLSGFDAFLYAM
jgi:hypothetical protein